MKLQVLRFSSEPDSTSGILMDVTDPYNKKFLAYTIEDEHRDEKIRGETRIPAGTYPVVLREEGGFSARYLKAYGSDFHKGMLWIKDVPGFEWILIHKGNDESATMGCLIIGNSQESNLVKRDGFIGSSVSAYKMVYPYVVSAIKTGGAAVTYVDFDGELKKPSKINKSKRIDRGYGSYSRFK